MKIFAFIFVFILFVTVMNAGLSAKSIKHRWLFYIVSCILIMSATILSLIIGYLIALDRPATIIDAYEKGQIKKEILYKKIGSDSLIPVDTNYVWIKK